MTLCPPPSYRPNITFGSNKFVKTNGVISFGGKDIFRIELSVGGEPLITVRVHDHNGKLLGKIWKSTFFTYVDGNYDAQTERKDNVIKRLTLRHKRENRIIMDIIFQDYNNVEINGIFYLLGLDFPIIATREYLDINSIKFKNAIITKNGRAVEVDNDFVRI